MTDLQLGTTADLVRGLDASWDPRVRHLNLLLRPPNQGLDERAVEPIEARGDWSLPTVTLHDTAESLLSEVLPYRVDHIPALPELQDLPAGVLIEGSPHDREALVALYNVLGVGLTDPDRSYALVRISREDGEARHPCDTGQLRKFARPRTPDQAFGVRPELHSAMVKLQHDGVGVPRGWGQRYGLKEISKALQFLQDWGTHFVARVTLGDTLFQVFSFKPENWARVRIAWGEQNRIEGRIALQFASFTTQGGKYGYVDQVGNLLSMSYSEVFRRSLKRTAWYEPTWAQHNSIFALFPYGKAIPNITYKELNETFTDQVPVEVLLAPLELAVEFKRNLFLQRVLQAAFAQKYRDRLKTVVPVRDERDLASLLPANSKGLVSTLATPHINVYKGHIDVAKMQLVAREHVETFTVMAQLLNSGDGSSVALPGTKSVQVYAQVLDMRTEQAAPIWHVADSAFENLDLACAEHLGGLSLSNTSGTAWAWIRDGIRFGLKGEGRDAWPIVAADLRTTPQEQMLSSLVVSLEYALSWCETVLSDQTQSEDSPLRRFAREGCAWFARFIPSTVTDLESLTMRVQALDLSAFAADPTLGAFVPLLPAEEYEETFNIILGYLTEIKRQIQAQEQQIATRRLAEQIADVGKKLNENIKQTGDLMVGVIKANRLQQKDLTVHYEIVVSQLKNEITAQVRETDRLEAALSSAESELQRAVQAFKTAAERQRLNDAVTFALDVAGKLFKIGIAFKNPLGTATGLFKVAKAVQLTVNTLNATIKLYDAVTGEIVKAREAAKALEALEGGHYGSGAHLPWDELSSQFKLVMKGAPKGDAIDAARERLEAAFSRMVEHGKALTTARSTLRSLRREVYSNAQQRRLVERQEVRLDKLVQQLNVPIKDLDPSAIDLLGLTGLLFGIQAQTTTVLSHTFLTYDQALQYEVLKPATPLSAFGLLDVYNARYQQRIAEQTAREALAQHVPMKTKPILWRIEGADPEALIGGNRLRVCVPQDAPELRPYVTARVHAVVARIEGVASTGSGRFFLELEFDDRIFSDRDTNRQTLYFNTPSRQRQYEYDANTGDARFDDDGDTWSKDVSQVTPFSTWFLSLPASQSNQDITFTGPTVNLELQFVLDVRVVDVASQLATPPPKEALVTALYKQGSATNGWDVVFSLSLVQINRSLRKQYDALIRDPTWVNVIDVGFDEHPSTRIRIHRCLHLVYGYPLLAFMENNQHQVKLTTPLLKGSQVEVCTYIDDILDKCEVYDGAGQTLTAYVAPQIVGEKIPGSELLNVQLNMEEGTFSTNAMEMSDQTRVHFNNQVKAYFVHNPVRFLINALNLKGISILSSLRPSGARFRVYRSEVLQLFIQTDDRPLLDVSKMQLNNISEPLSIGHECALLIRSELVFSEVLPEALNTGDWKLKGQAEDENAPSRAWEAKLEEGNVYAEVDMSALSRTESSSFIGTSQFIITRYTYSVRGRNPAPWSLAETSFTRREDGGLNLFGSREQTFDYLEDSKTHVFDTSTGARVHHGSGTNELQSKVALTVEGTLRFSVGGRGRKQTIELDSQTHGVEVTGHLSGGGPSGSDDFNAKVNQLIEEQIPPAIRDTLKVAFDPISIFALQNLLFPEWDCIKFDDAYIPGDMLVLGSFQNLEAP